MPLFFYMENIKIEHQKQRIGEELAKENKKYCLLSFAGLPYVGQAHLSGFDLIVQNKLLSKYDRCYLNLISRIIANEMIESSNYSSSDGKLNSLVLLKARETYKQPLEEILKRLSNCL